MIDRRTRVFLGTVEIAGFYTHLAAALRGIDVDCRFVELTPHPFQYAGNDTSLPWVVGLVRRIERLQARLFDRAPPRRLAGLTVYAISLALRIFVVLPWAMIRFDVFCFGFNTNIVGARWGYWDAALLRLIGKRVLFFYFGADSRPPYLTGPYVRAAMAGGPQWPQALQEMTRQRKLALRAMERYSHATIDVSVHGHFHHQKYINYARLGSPCRASEENGTLGGTTGVAADGQQLRVLHAPSDRAAKGSDLIAACIERLRAKGHDIHYVELHGLTHAEVMKELGQCDFVIDQMYSDFPLAGFAIEAASLGKAVVVCGYAQGHAWHETVPTHYCHPDELESAVTRLLVDPAYRQELGQRARQFVQTTWSAEAVARRWQRVFENDVPDEWWLDPAETTYVHGGGMSEELLRETLQALVGAGGPSALQLDDKPALRDRLLQLASVGSQQQSAGSSVVSPPTQKMKSAGNYSAQHRH